MNEAYEIARNGGTHYGTWKNYKDRPKSMLERAIKTMELRIEEHLQWIASPYIKLPSDADSRQIDALVNKKWPGDVARIQTEIDVLKGILESRNEE
ncbi:MAG: hypothetical protein PHE55_01815 [Methylococcaceae bacterium]|nr:hypothetical protein [Methylococcaceae bacterium]